KVLTRPEREGFDATIVELGAESLLLETTACLTLGDQVAVDFALPGAAKEINTIAKVLRPPPSGADQALCALLHLPLLERRRVQAWLDDEPPPRTAARNRVSRAG